MKIVNTKDILRVHSIYFNVKQPMYVYDSTEEFESNVDVKKTIRIRNVKEYMDWVVTLTGTEKEIKFDFGKTFINFIDLNVWFKTADRFVPSYIKPNGTIYYKVDEKGAFIPTDGCWVRLYYIVQKRTSHLLYTSAGMHLAAITNYGLSGGIKQNYSVVHESSATRTPEENAALKIKKIMRTKKPGVEHMRMMFAFFNPLSDTAHDLKKSFRAGFKRLPYKYMENIIASPAFKEAIMQTVKTIYPGLIDTIQKIHTPEKMADFLEKMRAAAEKNQNVDDMIKVFDKIVETGYAETEIGSMPNIPILPASQGLPGQIQVPLLSEEDIDEPTVREEETAPEAVPLTDAQIEEQLNEQGVPLSYVQQDIEPLINIED